MDVKPTESDLKYSLTSDRFDPAEALRQPERVRLPFPEAHPLDNINQCRYLLPEKDELRLVRKEQLSQEKAARKGPDRKYKVMQLTPTQAKEEAILFLAERMESR